MLKLFCIVTGIVVILFGFCGCQNKSFSQYGLRVITSETTKVIKDDRGYITGLIITDDQTQWYDLICLQQCLFLETLEFHGSPWDMQIGDESVPILAELTHLKKLVILNTLITTDGLSTLKQAMTNTEIVFEGRTIPRVVIPASGSAFR